MERPKITAFDPRRVQICSVYSHPTTIRRADGRQADAQNPSLSSTELPATRAPSQSVSILVLAHDVR
ncbi:hypothetical protein PAXRUDRAFT_823594 [Paxillus rubicundulus Ve08.2h10]|uniref:Uncharacterized protein n=1 Tax=Paxillus rubicundulus Ve08.2h10 TaxID=930991 RepID=A0A0D0DVC4_9AGAM|nr:hypothetical protein PAXRUDRAFT_823594 [Paxillus rubicundulus Ve08.2h10]